MEARELSKFEFTKGLSDAMELIAESGEKLGFSRGDMSYLDIETLIKIGNINETDVKPFLEEINSIPQKYTDKCTEQAYKEAKAFIRAFNAKGSASLLAKKLS